MLHPDPAMTSRWMSLGSKVQELTIPGGVGTNHFVAPCSACNMLSQGRNIFRAMAYQAANQVLSKQGLGPEVEAPEVMDESDSIEASLFALPKFDIICLADSQACPVQGEVVAHLADRADIWCATRKNILKLSCGI